MRRRGRTIPLSTDRRLVCDVINIANRMPTAPIRCDIDVTEIKHLRRLTGTRISWQVIMMRAFALVSRDVPELRQLYAPLPRPHIYEHHESVCLMTIARKYKGRERLFFARFCQPENYSLIQLQEIFENYRRAPIQNIRQLRHQIRFARMPWLIRKIGWSILTHLWPASRARQMGTFGMSLSSYRDVSGTFHLGPCTATLGYDQLCRKGKAYVTLTFDHRVLDGKPAIDVLNRLALVLKNQVTAEMRMIADHNPDTQIERDKIRLFVPEDEGLTVGMEPLPQGSNQAA